MPTLAASTSIFQLAFGVNAVLPVLISDFEAVRKQAADSILQKIKEYRPDFQLKERDRIDFVDFTFQSTRGLRHAGIITRLTAFISLALCGLSLAALCWSALKPDQQISSQEFFVFVGATLIGGPVLYFARNYFLKWLYKAFVSQGSNTESEAVLFAECVDIYLKHKKEWEKIEQQMDELLLKVPLLNWQIRIMTIKMGLAPMLHWFRSRLFFKRNRNEDSD
jgi:hypothetical protein